MSSGMIFDIQRFSINNGPGIRTTAFFKGCPLRCVWCHNPESFVMCPQLRYMEKLCHHCKACVPACPAGALYIKDGSISLQKDLCISCFTCTHQCVFGALTIWGQRMTAREAVEKLAADKVFFEKSGGGVTLSGGEPTMQPEFLFDILGMLRERKIHTTVDTNGYCAEEIFRETAGYADYILFDLKQIDTDAHKNGTGADNRLILENLDYMLKTGHPGRIRYPLIPGYNDAEEDIEGMCRWLYKRGVRDIDISVFHNYYTGKYQQLMQKEIPRIDPYQQTDIDQKMEMISRNGIKPILL